MYFIHAVGVSLEGNIDFTVRTTKVRPGRPKENSFSTNLIVINFNFFSVRICCFSCHL